MHHGLTITPKNPPIPGEKIYLVSYREEVEHCREDEHSPRHIEVRDREVLTNFPYTVLMQKTPVPYADVAAVPDPPGEGAIKKSRLLRVYSVTELSADVVGAELTKRAAYFLKRGI